MSKREKLTGLGIAVALGLFGGYAITRFPSVQESLILREHQQAVMGYDPAVISNGWGWAQRRQLHSPDLGPTLLRDPKVVERRLRELGGSYEELYKYSGEWALMYAGKRLQGKTNEEILGGYEGLRLTLATLAAEADPPAWWGHSPWLAEAVGAKPQGSFHLGLLGPDDVTRLVGQIEQCQVKELACLVLSVLRHEDGFTPQQRDIVLRAWEKEQAAFYNENNEISVKRALQARQGLTELLSGLGPPGTEVTLQLTYPEHTGALERKRLGFLFADYIRSAGYRCRLKPEAAQVDILVQLRPVDFDSVEVHHYEPYTTTERVSRKEYGGKYQGTRTIWEDKTVTKNERKTEIVRAQVISFVVTAQVGDRAVTLVIPPYSQVLEDTQQRVAGYLADFSTVDRFYWSYYLENDAARPWRYGLLPFHHEWELADFP